MDIPVSFEPWWRFGLALLIGTLIGLEREFIQQRSGDPDFAGIRTFALITLFGAVAAFLSNQFGIVIFLVSYLGLVLLIWTSRLGNIYRGESEGVTTEVVGLMMPFLGAMVFWGHAEVAAALGVVSALILALRPTLHSLARRMSAADLRATLEFALITAVVLPILPNEVYGPFEVLNPRGIWLLVVLVSGISFLGYILIKALGAHRGLGLTGLLGGLVSSTAVTLSFSSRSKETPGLSTALGLAIILASSTVFPRVLIEIVVVNAALLPLVTVPLIAMLLVGLVSAAIVWRRSGRSEPQNEQAMELKNPLKLGAAVGFAILFSLVLLAVRAAFEYAGESGIYATGAIAALADVDAITLSTSELSANGQIEERVAANTILLAVLVNTAMKGGLVLVVGDKELRRPTLWILGSILLVGIVSGFGGAVLLR